MRNQPVTLCANGGQSPHRAEDPTEAFARLLAANQIRIYSFILSLLPNMADADEVMQEVSMHLWRRFSEFESGSDFRAWACGVARYKVLDYRRQQQGKLNILLSDEALESVAQAAVQQSEALEERRLALHLCIQKLTARDRDLIERRMRPRATVPVISAQTGRSAAGLYKAFERIYRSLHECIERQISQANRS